jgi:GrpB-like predicted nucleotidyltransferase (UPF0157 family)
VDAYEQWLESIAVDSPKPLTQPIEIHDYDPQWPALYAREETRIRSLLGGRAVRIEHVGSTSVPSLPAKSVIDIVLEVSDSADEDAYAPALEGGGYRLTIREPEWLEHRVFNGPDTNVNLHVFTAGCEEVEAMLRFRDHLRANTADRELYAATKRELAARDWKYVQQYADAKTEVVGDILGRALSVTVSDTETS